METYTEQSSSENSFIEAFEQHPHFNHPFHRPHSLTRQSSLRKYWCASCHKCFENEHYYRCSECPFIMDLKCVFMDPIELCEGQPHIQHVSHQHPMPLVKISPNDQVVCFACQSPCLSTTPVYACAACDYFLHKRCGELQLYMLPSYDIFTLLDMERSSYSSPDDNTPGLLKINHQKQANCYILPHYLREYNFHSNHDCHRLSKLIDQYLPRLPQLLEKYLPKFLSSLLNHYRPNLVLSILRSNKCTACGFVIDVDCALTPPIILEGEEYYRHFNHPHPMILLTFLEKDDDDEEVDEYCSSCDSPCSGLVYSCTKCKYFLHKSCAQLPLRLISHPLHKHSFLTQVPHTKSGTEKLLCSLCYKKDWGSLFRCPHSFGIFTRRCKFMICGRCILGRPNIKYERHEHLLCLVEKIHDRYVECNAYDGYCKLPATSVELCSTESSMFRCVDCHKFNLHFLCGPLPRMIKYRYHVHTLILVDSVIEDDSGDYFCDICETERDPQICVYYCQECKYIAHVHCLKSEVITILKGDLRDVELKTVKIHNNQEKEEHKMASRGRKVWSFEGIISTLPENEAILSQCEFDWPFPIDYVRRLYHHGRTWKRDLGSPWVQIVLSRLNIEYFEKFIGWLDGFYYLERLELDMKFSSWEEIVIVESYMVHKAFARTLVLLLRKHGDVNVVRAFITVQATEEAIYFETGDKRGYIVGVDHMIQWLQEELATSLKSLADSNLMKSREFHIECLNIALKLGLDNYVANTLL
ncbi:Protein kinase C-like, phorbol ester/diacylglycerol-binding domain containing protein [Trema orientale]|uniref:Protein kinase C-like, phorbol ester/diacylglycerol-binding domain containing protein n=1 Tax=Trema orientale TaxID=63057 RepID=A0A2P5F4E6_TREOI|nr:Protein kinase C-like, phorbol ester/diacylglycerol-binding domain containing protein [Trema orientale]